MVSHFVPQSLLVVCTGNICRSPMAEVLLRQALPDCAVSSAGVGALVGHGADGHAIRLLAARGLDLEQHRACMFTGALGLANDLILTMSVSQREHIERRWPLLQGRVFTMGYFDDAEIEDPYRLGERAFRDALSDIDRAVEKWTAYLGA